MLAAMGPMAGPGMPASAMAGFGIMVLIYIVFMLAWVIGGIVLLVAAWRLMKAHESLAESARIGLEIVESKQAPRV